MDAQIFSFATASFVPQESCFSAGNEKEH